MTDPLLIFVHIPRTAGTSCWAALQEAYQPVKRRGREWPQVMICPHGHRMQEPESPRGYGLAGSWLEEYIAQVQANPYIRCIGGHLPYGLHAAFDDEPYKYLTILRNPIERVISLYSMMRARPLVYNDAGQAIGEPITHYWAEQYELDFLAMLEAGEFRLCNDQTRMITGGIVDVDYAKALLEQEYSFTIIEQKSSEKLFLPDVGVWVPFPHLNQLGAKQRRGKPPIERYVLSAQEFEAVQAANNADIALYEWARHQVMAYD